MGTHEYEVMISGLPHTFRLTDEQAKARGLTPPAPAPEVKQSPAPKNKARTTPTKG